MEHKMVNENIKFFILAGRALFTVKNEKTGNRFTFKVEQLKEETIRKKLWFVKVLTSPDNENGYSFIGTIKPNKIYKHSTKSRITEEATSVKAFRWLFDRIKEDNLPDYISVFHEGHCGRCGKTLTVPESIMSGFGPECVKRR